MSETDTASPVVASIAAPSSAAFGGSGFGAQTPAENMGLPMAFSTFATSLRPRTVPLLRKGVPVVHQGRTVTTATPGHPDEIWLKILKIRHGGEKHTATEWFALINRMKNEPAHPSDPRMT